MPGPLETDEALSLLPTAPRNHETVCASKGRSDKAYSPPCAGTTVTYGREQWQADVD